MPAIFRSKGKSGVIALGYCVPLSYIFMLIVSPEGSANSIIPFCANYIASYECRDILLLAMRVLGSYRLPLALREKSV